MSGSSSEEDMPEAVSFKESKIEHENLDNQIKDFIKEQRNALKDKRRKKQETLVTLKKGREERQKRVAKIREKATLSSEEEGRIQQEIKKRMLPTDILSALKSDVPSPAVTLELNQSSEEDDDATPTVRVMRPRKMKKKVYDKLNIRVEALTQLENKRAVSALDFRSKRFGKAHRESVDKNRIHQEKLIASGQKLMNV